MTTTLDQSQHLDAPLEEVFAFFSDARNLARITPPWLRFRIHGAAPSIAEGARIEYRIRWLFFTLRWVTRITRFSPPFEFQDVQERGPYRAWLHTHSFSREGTGVRMHDRVEFELPFGILGKIALGPVVRHQLAAIFDYRRSAVESIFSGTRGAGG